MMRVLLWKEYREHRSIWLAMAGTATVLLIGVAQLMTPASSGDDWSRAALAAAAVVLAWTYGMVCGGMMLAGERENGTLAFLDTLPLRRGQLWRGKCLIGVFLILTQGVVLAALTVGLKLYSGWGELALILFLLGWFGLMGLAWGLVYSANGHNVLLVVGLAIATQFVAGIGLLVIVQVAFLLGQHSHLGEGVGIVAAVLAVLGMGVVPLVMSAHLFSRPDRLRQPDRLAPVLASSRGGYPVRATVWLTWQQMKALSVGLVLFSLLAGFVMLAPNPLLWPLTTLFLGVLCGVTAFGDEQMFGSRRFLGDQRFPLNRLWLTKLLLRLGLCLLAAVVMFLPSAIRAAQEVSRPAHSLEVVGPGMGRFFATAFQLDLLGIFLPVLHYLLLGLLYGFSLGHLCGLLFRRSIVSAVLALGCSGLLLSLWVPSLVCGGLHLWQPLGVPLLAVATSRLLLAPWAADRIVSRRPLLTLSGCIALMLLWTVGGLYYRVQETPAAAEPFDVADYSASLPSFDENKAMQHFRSACAGVLSQERSVDGKQQDASNQMQHILQRGWTEKWPAGMQPLGPWLDQVFAGDWTKDVVQGADAPVGVMEDPRLATLHARLSYQTQGVSEIANLLVCQGLRRQAEGDPAAFVEYLRQGLALARTLENKALPIVALQGHACEHVLGSGVQRWLERLKGRPELLRQVLRLLSDHEAAGKTALTEQMRSHYLMLRNTLELTPEQLPAVLLNHISEGEEKAFTWSLQMPWEHARQERILNSLYSAGDDAFPSGWRGPPSLQPYGSALYACAPSWDRLLQKLDMHLCRLRAIRQVVALRLYQEESGKPAESLSVLIPKYLAKLPVDPLASGSSPFLYQLSHGEWVEVDEGTTPIEALFEQGQPGRPAAPEVGMGGAGAPAKPQPGVGQPGMPGGAMAPAHPSRRFAPRGQGILWSAGDRGREGVVHVRRQELTWLVPLPSS